MKRVLALALALLLIVAALLFRSSRDNSDDLSTDGGDGGGGELVLGCVSELVELCESLDDVKVVAVDPGEVVEAVREIDGWVTFEPWPEAEAFDNPELFDGKTVALGEDRLGLVLSGTYETALQGDCDEPLTECAAKAIGERGELGVGDPETATGSVLLLAAATEIIGASNFGSDEINENRSLLDDVKASSEPVSSERQLAQRLGLGTDAPIAILCRGHVASVVESERGVQKQLVFREITPVQLLRVVLAPIDRSRRDDLQKLAEAESTAEAFRSAGWSEPTEGPTGLPQGDVLIALNE